MTESIDITAIKQAERTALRLKSLYRSYGYVEYRLGGFEDYSLYAENGSFLDGKGVLTFNVGGRLTAMRPDVTLSVVKSAVNKRFGTEKLFYDERVYRKTAYAGEFTELRQVGVEVIGDVDGVTEAEVCTLAIKTLSEVGGNKIALDISHARIIEKAIDKMNLPAEAKNTAVKYLESKNVHDFCALAEKFGVDGEAKEIFTELMTLPADPQAAISALKKRETSLGISSELKEIYDLVSALDSSVNIDFSVGGDADYYSGIVFRGYVDGVPFAVLKGGRYDRLLRKFGRRDKYAIGFALYLGELDGYFNDVPDVPDSVVIYTEESAQTAVKRAEELRKSGQKVLLAKSVPEGFGGKIYTAEDLR